MCEPDSGLPVGAIVKAGAIVAGALVAWRVLAAGVAAVVPFLAMTILAADALGLLAFVRLVKYGSPAEVFRRHRRPATKLQSSNALPALTAGQPALEARKPAVHAVITDVKEKAHR